MKPIMVIYERVSSELLDKRNAGAAMTARQRMVDYACDYVLVNNGGLIGYFSNGYDLGPHLQALADLGLPVSGVIARIEADLPGFAHMTHDDFERRWNPQDGRHGLDEADSEYFRLISDHVLPTLMRVLAEHPTEFGLSAAEAALFANHVAKP